MRTSKKSQRRHSRGSVLVWVAITLIVLLGFLGLSIDIGIVYLSSHQLQNAADAAAMAATRVVRDDPEFARDEAIRIAQENNVANDGLVLDRNDENLPDGDIVIGRFDREEGTFTPGLDAPNAVQVTGRRNATSPGGRVALLFGGIFGVDGANIVRTGLAMVGGGTGSGMIALGDGPCTISVDGNVTVTVDGGDIQINSDDKCALCSNGGPVIDAPGIYVHGDACLSSNTVFEGNLYPASPPVPDPLEFLPAPPIVDIGITERVYVRTGDVESLGPGYYPEGISVSGGALDLAPGIYVVGKPQSGSGSGGQYPAGLNISGGTVIGENVMIYILDGALDIGANANVTLTPPDPDVYNFDGADIYEHVSIFQSRENDYNARIAGGPGLNISGTLYFPENELNLVGSGEGQFGNQILAHTFNLSGNGDIHINYNGSFPSAGNTLFLVR